MKPGFSWATGHDWEFVCSDHDKRTNANIRWDDEKKEFIKGRFSYPKCVDCKQFAWGAKSMCPMNTRVEKKPMLVVSKGAE